MEPTHENCAAMVQELAKTIRLQAWLAGAVQGASFVVMLAMFALLLTALT